MWQVGLHHPHPSFSSPAHFFNSSDFPYATKELPLPSDPLWPPSSPTLAFSNVGGVPGRRTPTTVTSASATREFIHGYLAGVSFADFCMGLVLDELEAGGLADETVVAITGDQ